MKATRVIVLLLFVLVSNALADYLVVSRPAALRASASSNSEKIEALDEGQQLNLLATAKTHGYYRAKSASTGNSGYVYGTFVRRYQGEMESNGEDVKASTTTSTRDFSKYEGEHTFAGYPKAKQSGDFKLLENIGYAIGYSESRKDPLWATYKCEWVDAASPGKRPGKFKVDSRTESELVHEDFYQADYRSNRESYDRGHMAPNYAIATRYGREAQLETFLMSNVCPQRKTLNQQTWEALEKRIATSYSYDNERVWVTVGPVFSGNPRRLNGKAAIPKAFYAIVLDDHTGNLRVLSLIMGQDVSGLQPLDSFVVPIDSIESVTGLDFFSDLPNSVENDIESSWPDESWDLFELLIPTPR